MFEGPRRDHCLPKLVKREIFHLYKERRRVLDSNNSNSNFRTRVCPMHGATEQAFATSVALKPPVPPAFLELPIFLHKSSMCLCMRASCGFFFRLRENTHAALHPKRWYTYTVMKSGAPFGRRKHTATCGQTQSVASHTPATIDARVLGSHLPVSDWSKFVQVLQHV